MYSEVTICNTLQCMVMSLKCWTYSIATDQKSSSRFCSRIPKFTTPAQDPHMYEIIDLAECKLTAFSCYSCYKVHSIFRCLDSTQLSNPLSESIDTFWQPCHILFHQMVMLQVISSTISTVYLFSTPILQSFCKLFQSGLPLDI